MTAPAYSGIAVSIFLSPILGMSLTLTLSGETSHLALMAPVSDIHVKIGLFLLR